MTWVKLDDSFPWHPKVSHLSDGAYRLFVSMLCYCNRYNGDGAITDREVFREVGSKTRGRRLAAELVEARLWDLTETGWAIHHYFDYQPDPKKQAAGRIGGRKSAQADAQARAQADAQAGRSSLAQTPTRPDPTRPVKAEESNSRAARGTMRGLEPEKLSAVIPAVVSNLRVVAE